MHGFLIDTASQNKNAFCVVKYPSVICLVIGQLNMSLVRWPRWGDAIPQNLRT